MADLIDLVADLINRPQNHHAVFGRYPLVAQKMEGRTLPRGQILISRGQWSQMIESEPKQERGLLATLVLEDGRIFTGRPFGAVDTLRAGRRGEIVFSTSMMGYQEICTDPSYRGQMVVLTNPLIGNYGVTLEDAESCRPWLSALIVRDLCDEFSNWRGNESLSEYLARYSIPGICDVDTRALTRHLRMRGTLRGVIVAGPADHTPDVAMLTSAARQVQPISALAVVEEVARGPSVANELEATGRRQLAAGTPCVVLIDAGYKNHIAQCLIEQGLVVQVASHTIDLPNIFRLRPGGVVLSNGPGDPQNMEGLIGLSRGLIHAGIPVLGICLGLQIIGLAAGGTTSRLAFGHHGANHPVIEVRTGRVSVTAQNHNFQLDAGTLPPSSGFYVSHVNLSDGSVEGIAHEELPIFGVQFHPEGAPGPEDNREIFARFAQVIRTSDRPRSHRVLRDTSLLPQRDGQSGTT